MAPGGQRRRQVEEVDDEMHLLKMKPRILGGQIAKAPFIEIEIDLSAEMACHAESCLAPNKNERKKICGLKQGRLGLFCFVR